jgi:hypothetical protein
MTVSPPPQAQAQPTALPGEVARIKVEDCEIRRDGTQWLLYVEDELLRRLSYSEEALVNAALRASVAAPPSPVPQWQPIETAPQDGSYFLAANQWGVWVATYAPKAVSGYEFDDPVRTVMLNHWHIKEKRQQYLAATHWMPLPAAPQADGAPK